MKNNMFKIFICLSGILVFGYRVCFSQPPDTLWTTLYGESDWDAAHSVIQTPDQGYVFTGNTKSFGAGDYDLWLVKTNSSGDTMWSKTYGGVGEDKGYRILTAQDSGYIILGYTASYGAGLFDIWLIKTDTAGSLEWMQNYGGNSNEVGYDVTKTVDGGFIISGYTASFGAGGFDWYVIKTDCDGDTLWTKTFGDIGQDRGISVQPTASGGYLVTGWTTSLAFGAANLMIIKMDSSGDTLWSKTYGGSSDDWSRSAQMTSDGGLIISGVTMSYGHGFMDVWLVKTDMNGDTLWTKTYGGINGDGGYAVRETPDGGYIITAHTQSFGAGNDDAWIIRTDSLGDTLWTKLLGGNQTDFIYDVQLTANGGYIVAGETNSSGSSSYPDAWLIRLATDPVVNSIKLTPHLNPSGFQLLQNYPNPFNSSTVIKYTVNPERRPRHYKVSLKVYDVTGREVAVLVNENQSAGHYKKVFDAGTLPSGIYFYRLKAASQVLVRKMLLIR